MRTTPALRTLAAALLTGGTLAVAAAGTTAAAAPSAPSTYAEGHGGGGSPIWGTIVSRTDLNVRQSPTTRSPVVDSLSPGSQDRVQCVVRGQTVNGNPDWYWLVGAQAWASAAFVDTGGRSVPSCSDPCPGWKDGDNSNRGDNNSSWNNDPNWGDNSSSWSTSASGSWSVSGSWSWSASGSSTGGGIWNWAP
ncbi:SH3 domain-containing protein [Streptomyces sp. MBT65]|uniref:SH3 domain-containing protein n=1 Tax=Streptomyces sp. MBT65 TaxID=1488395 RepID=UPI00190AC65F|nr:SH3 domain-containing protein [Streptomyces sp. MBT65]MBK3576738.1 SH3 domain-containing protein [Streptomyces sp. MBT65]